MEPSQPRYPKRGTSSRGSWNRSSVTLNFTKNEVLIPVQGPQFPSNLTPMEHAPQQTRLVSHQQLITLRDFHVFLFSLCYLFLM